MYLIRDKKYNQCYTTLAFFLYGYPQYGVNNPHFFHTAFPSLPSTCGRIRISRRVTRSPVAGSLCLHITHEESGMEIRLASVLQVINGGEEIELHLDFVR